MRMLWYNISYTNKYSYSLVWKTSCWRKGRVGNKGVRRYPKNLTVTKYSDSSSTHFGGAAARFGLIAPSIVCLKKALLMRKHVSEEESHFSATSPQFERHKRQFKDTRDNLKTRETIWKRDNSEKRQLGRDNSDETILKRQFGQAIRKRDHLKTGKTIQKTRETIQ